MTNRPPAPDKTAQIKWIEMAACGLFHRLAADGIFENEEHQVPFVEYLLPCFRCGKLGSACGSVCNIDIVSETTKGARARAAARGFTVEQAIGAVKAPSFIMRNPQSAGLSQDTGRPLKGFLVASTRPPIVEIDTETTATAHRIGWRCRKPSDGRLPHGPIRHRV